MQLISTSKDHLNLTDFRTVPRELVINAAAHQTRADLCRGDLQLRICAEFVASYWEVGNIFRELLN